MDQTHLSFQRGQEAWLAEFEKWVWREFLRAFIGLDLAGLSRACGG